MVGVVICREPEFWRAVSDHPEVRAHAGGNLDIATVISRSDVLPFRCGRGGYLFHRLDPQGLVYELHALFEPSAWGREASTALKTALGQFAWQVVTVLESASWWRSRPPRSFGFRPAGDFEQRLAGLCRAWVLTRTAWEQSPVHRRMR